MDKRRFSFKMVEDRHELAARFQPGDIVSILFVSDGQFTGEVIEVDNFLGKVYVSIGGKITQMDPEEIRICDIQKVREVELENEEISDVTATVTRPAKLASKMLSAIYHCDLGRKYKLTQQEQDSGIANCPRCHVEMDREPFARGVYLYRCGNCDFKITTDDLYDAEYRRCEDPACPEPVIEDVEEIPAGYTPEMIAQRLVRTMVTENTK